MNSSIHISAQLGSLSLQVESSISAGITLISGENGAGKSTLLRCLAGLEKAHGQIHVGGQVWLDSSAGFNLPVEQRNVGCLWTDTALLPWLSVEKNILLGSDDADHGDLMKLAELLEISPLMQRKPHMLSTGEAQRVALSRAIFKRPALLLLDEPFSAQAPAIRQRLRVALKAVAEELKIAVVMVSHDVEDAKLLADSHWHMREGRLLAEVKPISELLRAEE